MKDTILKKFAVMLIIFLISLVVLQILFFVFLLKETLINYHFLHDKKI